MKTIYKGLFLGILLLCASFAVAAQQSGGYTIETISIGDAENPPPYNEETTVDEHGNTLVKKTGKFPTAKTIREALKKGRPTAIGVVEYNQSVQPWNYTWAHLVTVTAINCSNTTVNNFTVTGVQVFDPAFNVTIDTTIWEKDNKTYLFIYNSYPFLEDQTSIYKNEKGGKSPNREGDLPKDESEEDSDCTKEVRTSMII
tara:strand:+ start:17351 stop:17950 length:600 start_codon:yes stop_codon:yes gene_type:complete